MSVIVKMPEANVGDRPVFKIICKGADSMIMSLLEDRNSDLALETAAHVDNCAGLGLRTLLVAQRIMSTEEVSQWQLEFQANKKLDITDQEKAQRKTGENLEKNLQIVGGTAIEDSLQEKVGETLESLRKAGIRTW